MLEGAETAGAVVVKLQIVGIHVFFLKEDLGNLVICAGVGIGRVVIAAANVRVDEHVGRFAGNNPIVDSEIHLLDLPQAALVHAPHIYGSGVYQHAPGAVVKLEPAASGGVYGLDKLLIGYDKIINEFLLFGVVFLCILLGKGHNHLRQELGRGGNGEFSLGVGTGQLVHKAEVVDERMRGAHGNLPGEECVVNHGRLSVERETGLGGGVVHAVKPPHEVQMPGLTAKLSVGDYLEAQFFLLGDEGCDGCIFHLFEVEGRDVARGKLRPGVFQGLRAQETAHEVGPLCCFKGLIVHRIHYFICYKGTTKLGKSKARMYICA